MKIYLIALTYFLEPGASRPAVIWQDAIAFETHEVCELAGSRYKYLVEGIRGYEVEYKCVAFSNK